MIIPDGTLVIQIINFVLFWTLLNVLFIRPTQTAIARRQAYVAALRADAAANAAQAKALWDEAAGIVNAAAKRADEILRKAAAEALATTASIESAASAEAAALVESARATVALEQRQALDDQADFVEQLARRMVDQAVGGTEKVA